MSYKLLRVSDLSGVPTSYTLSGADMFQGSIGTNTASLSTVKVTFNNIGKFISSPYNTNAIWVSSGNVYAPGTGNVGIGLTTTAAVTEKLTVTGNISANGSLSATGTGSTYVNGDVGIRTARPYADLDVVDSTAQTVVRAVNTNTDGSIFFGAGQTTSSQDLPFYIRRFNSSHTVASAGNVEFYNNGSIHFRTTSSALDRVVIDNAGQVGIGTTSPGDLLEVASTGSSRIRIESGDSGASSLDLYDNGSLGARVNCDSSNNLELMAGGRTAADLIINTTTGNVGIGTTAPVTPLHVHRTDSAGPIIHFTNSTTGATDSDGASFGIDSNENAQIWQREANAIVFGTSNDEKVRIDSSGNVGIGTTTPAATLDVTGTDAIIIPAGTSAQRPTAETGMLRYNSTTSSFEGYHASTWSSLGGVRDVDGDTYILAETSSGNDDDTLHFWQGGTERITMTSSGWIPVTDSEMTLGASGKYWSTAYIDDVTISNDLTVSDEANITNALNVGQINVGTATGSSVGQIRASGDIWAFNTSDIKFKKNIAPISDSLSKLNQIRGVEFDWTDLYINMNGGLDDTFIKRHDVGVIAQEVEAVLPEVVTTRDDGTKAVRYEKIVPLLIEAIKELNEKVERLEGSN